jgi:hypothetical protein
MGEGRGRKLAIRVLFSRFSLPTPTARDRLASIPNDEPLLTFFVKGLSRKRSNYQRTKTPMDNDGQSVRLLAMLSVDDEISWCLGDVPGLGLVGRIGPLVCALSSLSLGTTPSWERSCNKTLMLPLFVSTTCLLFQLTAFPCCFYLVALLAYATICRGFCSKHQAFRLYRLLFDCTFSSRLSLHEISGCKHESAIGTIRKPFIQSAHFLYQIGDQCSV